MNRTESNRKEWKKWVKNGRTQKKREKERKVSEVEKNANWLIRFHTYKMSQNLGPNSHHHHQNLDPFLWA